MKKDFVLNSKELIYELYKLCSNRNFKKPKPLPMFTIREAQFIRDLIFLRPKALVYFYLADHIENRTEIGRMGLFNGRDYRRYHFLKHFIDTRGNAAKAAILAGYSPRSAKQQGHRVLRHIQSFRKPITPKDDFR